MKLVDKDIKNNTIVSITVQVDKPAEMAAYRKIPALEKCHVCGKPVNPKDQDLKLIIPNPLSEFIPGTALDVGQVVTTCSNCGADVIDDTQCDLSAFPEVMSLLVKLRQAARAQAAAKRGGAKRG